MVSISNEDFLKQVYMLRSLGYKSSASLLSERLGISNAAVTDMSRKLAREGLIDYRKYREIMLTAAGEKIAVSVIRRHRLWELFLNKILGIPWEKVHDEAERLEHQTSKYLIDEIDKFLGYPVTDPHGDPIPDESGHIHENHFLKLSQVKPPAKVKLKRVAEHTTEVMDFLNRSGCELNKEFMIASRHEDKNELVLQINQKKYLINTEMADKLHVELLI